MLFNLLSDYLSTGYHRARDEEQDNLDHIIGEIRSCTGCGLHTKRINAAPGEGCPTPLVMVIGEGPGQEEDEQGRPFVGKAGQLLDKMLASIGLSRNENTFIANVIKCRPPNNRDPLPEETSACANFLKRQILLLKPKYILAAGRVAAQTLLKTNEAIGKLRGKFYDYKIDSFTIPLLATYHPSALLRDESYKRPAWEDLKLIKARLDESGGK
ncbi:MAG: uracil-DNA glycosylase [Treponema sp.]|jgi:DNA polymerase|nr:uracil-DNA glycosylase [Treponema sp.]